MAARDKVLGTYELLEAILTNSTPHTIESAVRVSKAWNAVAGQSKRICLARVLAPVHAPGASSSRRRYPATPYYDVELPIRLHPGLSCSYDRRESLKPGVRNTYYVNKIDTIFIWHEDFREYYQNIDKTRFITHPPIQTVIIRGKMYSSRRRNKDASRLLHRAAGLRMKDLLDATARRDNGWDATADLLCAQVLKHTSGEPTLKPE